MIINLNRREIFAYRHLPLLRQIFTMMSTKLSQIKILEKQAEVYFKIKGLDSTQIFIISVFAGQKARENHKIA
jgi:hypothetical protein